MNGDEYVDQSALALHPWFCWSQRYFRCRLPPFAAVTPLPAARDHISLLAYTCCLCRSVPIFGWDVTTRAIECVCLAVREGVAGLSELLSLCLAWYVRTCV